MIRGLTHRLLHRNHTPRMAHWALSAAAVLTLGEGVLVWYWQGGLLEGSPGHGGFPTMGTLARLHTWLWIAASICAAGLLFLSDEIRRLLDAAAVAWRGASTKCRWALASALAAGTLAMYVSTGTLSPYANTIDVPSYLHVDEKCGYIYNGDYYHFARLFFLLDGKPREAWESSIVVHRILFNALAYPLMKILGHDLGGVAAGVLLTCLAMAVLAVFLLRTQGERSAVAGVWLLSLYPGIAYYIGQPFLYSLIVPGCVVLYVGLYELDRARSLRRVALISVFMGGIFTGYDFAPFFGVAAILLLAARRRWVQIPVAAAGMALLPLLWLGMLRWHLHCSPVTANSRYYFLVIANWLQAHPPGQWGWFLSQVPGFAVENFLFSTFLFLPAAFCVSMALGLRQARLPLPDVSVLLAAGLVFLIVNATPPLQGDLWQPRGSGIARLYQPIFVVLLMHICRVYEEVAYGFVRRRIMTAVLVTVLASNGLIVFGPILNDPGGFSSHMYWRFYKHGSPHGMKANLLEHGRRPYGFCR